MWSYLYIGVVAMGVILLVITATLLVIDMVREARDADRHKRD